MGKIIPVGSTDCTLIFECAGISDPLAVGLGIQATPEKTAAQIAASVRLSAFTAGLTTPANMMTAYTFVGVEASKMTATGAEVAFAGDGATGTIAQPPPPVNCSLLVTKVTAGGGRQNRGRMFWPPANLDEASVDPAGNVATAVVINLQARYDLFFSELVENEGQPILFHSTRPDGSNPPIIIPTVITNFRLDTQIATQRRRMR